LRVPTPQGDRVFRAHRPHVDGLRDGGQRTEMAARQASRSVSPGDDALTRWPLARAVFIPSQGCSVPRLQRRLRDRHRITTDSEMALLGFPTRDRDRTGFVAVEALQRLINRADPSLEMDQLWFPPEASLGTPS